MAQKEKIPKVIRNLQLIISTEDWLALKNQAKRHGYLRTDVWQTFCTPKIAKITNIGKVRSEAQQFMIRHDRHGLQKKPAVTTIINAITLPKTNLQRRKESGKVFKHKCN